MTIAADGMAFFAVTAVVAAVAPAIHLLRSTHKPGARYLVALCAVCAAYPAVSVVFPFDWAVNLRFALITWIAPLYLLTLREYLGFTHRAGTVGIFGYAAFASAWALINPDFLPFMAVDGIYSQPDNFMLELSVGGWFYKSGNCLLMLTAVVLAVPQFLSSRIQHLQPLILVGLPVAICFADLFTVPAARLPVLGVSAADFATTLGLVCLNIPPIRRGLLKHPPVPRSLLLGHIREAVCVVNEHCEIEDCNEPFARTTKLPLQSLLRRKTTDVLDAKLLLLLQQAPIKNLDISIDSRDGIGHYNASVAPLSDDRPNSLVISLTDITERILALDALEAQEDELRASNAKLQHLSYSDPLTGLANRRRFHDQLVTEQSANGGEGIGLVMIDIDHFKVINDTHGHDAGDAVLVSLAKTMQNNCRDQDLVARVGGEEFVVLLCNTDLLNLKLAAERLRLSIRRTKVALDNGVILQVTASIGAAMMQPNQTAENLIHLADGLLYDAKHNGRDCVKIAAAPKKESVASIS